MADDGVSNGISAVVLPYAFGGFKNTQFRHAVRAVSVAGNAQRTRIVQGLQQQSLSACFILFEVMCFYACGFEQLGHHQFVLVRALAQIYCG